MSKHLRVLSINGGGVRGIIPSKILEHLSITTGKQIPELFDFIIGTSVGGMLAAAYAAPARFNTSSHSDVLFNASEVLSLLKDNAKYIFPKDQAQGGTSLLYQEKYTRSGIDTLLQENFRVNGADLKLIDTLVPIALTSQNAVAHEPQLWFSCSKTFSTYSLKDAAGATSAAPIYIPPKFIDVQNQTQAKAQDCSEFDLIKGSDGNCQYKELDGGLFANSPTLLAVYLLGQVMLNKTISSCAKYNIFDNSSLTNNSIDLLLQFASMNPANPPKLHLGNNIDITVVSIGTGYFADQVETDFNVVELASGYIDPAKGYAKGAEGVLSTYIAISGLYTIYNIYKLGKFIYDKTEIDGDTCLAKTITAAIAILPPAIASVGLILASIGLWGTEKALAFLKDADSLIANIDSEGGGIIGFAKDTLLGILAANEAADITLSRDTFGAITINPIFYNLTSIPLDASDDYTLNLMENITNSFINQNLQAFDNLTVCLNNTAQRVQECDNAAMYFYDNFRDSATHGIISQPLVEEQSVS